MRLGVEEAESRETRVGTARATVAHQVVALLVALVVDQEETGSLGVAVEGMAGGHWLQHVAVGVEEVEVVRHSQSFQLGAQGQYWPVLVEEPLMGREEGVCLGQVWGVEEIRLVGEEAEERRQCLEGHYSFHHLRG